MTNQPTHISKTKISFSNLTFRSDADLPRQPKKKGAKIKIARSHVIDILRQGELIRKDFLVSELSATRKTVGKTARLLVDAMIKEGSLLVEKKEPRQRGGHCCVWLRAAQNNSH